MLRHYWRVMTEPGKTANKRPFNNKYECTIDQELTGADAEAIDVLQTQCERSPGGSTCLGETTSWPPSGKCDVKLKIWGDKWTGESPGNKRADESPCETSDQVSHQVRQVTRRVTRWVTRWDKWRDEWPGKSPGETSDEKSDQVSHQVRWVTRWVIRWDKWPGETWDQVSHQVRDQVSCEAATTASLSQLVSQVEQRATTQSSRQPVYASRNRDVCNTHAHHSRQCDRLLASS